MFRSLRIVLAGSLFVIGLAGCIRDSGPDAGAVVPETAQHRELHILIVADPHIDPFRNAPLVDRLAAAHMSGWPFLLQSDGDAPFAMVGHDANPSLLLSAFTAMQRAVPDPDVVFVLGDLLAHDFHEHFIHTAHKTDDAAYHDFIDKTAAITPLALHALYPHAQILPTVGNNDGYCGDYRSTPRDAFLAHQAAEWEPLADLHGLATHFVQTYAKGGYYEARLPNGIRVLGLNSVLFSAAYENACGDPASHPADEELRWLQTKVDESHAPPTLLLTHIPPGIDAFKSFLHLGKPAEFYQDTIQKRLFNELATPQVDITAMITGHLHDIGYRIIPVSSLRQRDTGIPVYSAPSISPIFGNSPAFVEMDLSPQGRIDNITVYELETEIPVLRAQPGWHRAYDFNNRYGLNGLTAASIRHLHQLEQTNIPLREMVERDRVGGGPAGAIGSLSWRTAWCSEIFLDPVDYVNCEGVPKMLAPFYKH